ncbi:MAG TPA: exopolysaccharide biosynthesis protein [Sphingobium sp.]|nr:exopolysaccharide biosynthesis protein [Sphingobium sp.]
MAALLDEMRALAEQQERVAIGDVVEALGARSFAPFLVLVPLIDISPIGGIPGLPTAMAATVILVAAQILFGRTHLWLPGFAERRSVSAPKLCNATNKARPMAERLDRWFHGRLPRLTRGAWVKGAAAAVILLACAAPPLELLPFATTAPMLAILFFGIALLIRDGLLMILACLATAGVVVLGISLSVSGGA